MKKHKCHFIGIGGIGMSGLAQLLLEKNIEVSGSDLVLSPRIDSLVASGAKIHIGHSPEHLPEGARVIYTTGVDENNPEYLAAKQRGYTLLHRSDLLVELTSSYQTIAIAGMHGKTTTSALMAAVLKEAGADPSFAIGGIAADFQSNSRQGFGPYFVIEACESDGTFLKYKPAAAIITNIDLEHMDYYETEANVQKAFTEFIDKVSSGEHLLWCGDDERLQKVATKGISYGFGPGCAWRISNLRNEGWGICFDLAIEDICYQDISLALLGRHNALNGAAVFALALILGFSDSAIRRAFASFKGISRRCEIKGESRGILILDDYGHHPVEIQTTLQGIREAIGERRMVVVYQPHRFTCARDCLGSYKGAFDAADEIVVTELYAAGECPIPGIDDARIYEDIKSTVSMPLSSIPQSRLIEYLAKSLRPHDVLVTLGAGDVTQLGNELLEFLKLHPIRKMKVALIFGGNSCEHEISLLSAFNIDAALKLERYDLEYFAISKTGRWIYGSDAYRYLHRQAPAPKEGGDTVSSDVLERLMKCEMVFPVLHGPFGEDGTIQGFFEILGKPYVGCGHRASAVCMDKALTKLLVKAHGIPTLNFISFTRHEWQNGRLKLIDQILEDLPLPIFVKPSHLGSSLGISKVSSECDLEAAIELAFTLDTHVLIEEGIAMRELEFAVLGNDSLSVYPPGEIFTDGHLYDYDRKYTMGSIVPVASQASDLSPELIKEGIDIAARAFKAIGCSGMARVDMFLDRNHKLWLNEINPIPGFTKNSLYPLICVENGLPFPELLDKLIVLGLHQFRKMRICI